MSIMALPGVVSKSLAEVTWKGSVGCGPQGEDKVHRGREGMVVGAVNELVILHLQAGMRERGMPMMLSSLLLSSSPGPLPPLRVGLSSPVTPLWKHAHKHIQRNTSRDF